MSREETIRDLKSSKIVVILRGLTKEQLFKTVEAMYKGGIRFAEVTFDQSKVKSDEETASDIKYLADSFKGKVHIGAGTVMTVEQVELAHKAGAEFIISPDTFCDVIKRTRELEMVSIPGAFTPTESSDAYRFGADFVKLFPFGNVDISYLKNLSLPLSHINFLAVGGVNPQNVDEILNAGAKGIGVSSGIVNKKYIAEENYEKITELSELYTRAIK